MKGNCFLSVLLFYVVGQAYGQETILMDTAGEVNVKANREYIKLYKENSPLSYTSPFSELGAPAKYLLSGRLTTVYMLFAPSKLPLAFAIQPDFTVRVRTEKSAGVRTPSFKLGGSLYYRLPGVKNGYRYLTMSYTHHSNGQDGEAKQEDGSINTINGNFTTNYLTLAGHFGTSSSSGPSKISYSYNHSTAAQIAKWFGYEPALEDDYGFTRLLYGFSWRRYTINKEKWRFNTELSYAINQMKSYNLSAAGKRVNTEISFHYALPFMNNVFLMVTGGYYGEDPYNIYYQDRYAFARFGISTGFLRQNR